MSDDRGQTSRLHELVYKTPEEFWPFEYRYDGLVNTPFDLHVSKDGWSSDSVEDFEEHAAYRYAEAVEHRNHMANLVGITEPEAPSPVLTDQQERVFDLIKSEGPITGTQILNRIGGGQSSLTTHIIPVLKEHGVKNKPGAGYYFDPSGERGNGAAMAR